MVCTVEDVKCTLETDGWNCFMIGEKDTERLLLFLLEPDFLSVKEHTMRSCIISFKFKSLSDNFVRPPLMCLIQIF